MNWNLEILLTVILWSAFIVWRASRMNTDIKEQRKAHESLHMFTDRVNESLVEHCSDGDKHCNPRTETDFRVEMRDRMKEFSGRLEMIEGYLLDIKRNGGR